jgi:hypothetical protein
VRDLADGGRDRVVDDEQVVVGVKRKMFRIERPGRLSRGANEFFGKRAAREPPRRRNSGRANADPMQESPAGEE